MSTPEFPPFEKLGIDPDGPPGNAWGLWGRDDELGMLNLLTAENTVAASKLIVDGKRISIDLHLDEPKHPFFNRQVFYHHIHLKAPRAVFDDVLLLNTQSSTQWDGFRHYAHQTSRKFYNGATEDDIRNSHRIGTNVWVEKGGIVGRGVLLDYAAFAARHNICIEPFSTSSISVAHLKQLADEENITFRPGDILFIRSGFTAAYRAFRPDEEATLPARKGSHFIGVESSMDTLQWIWENKFAAVAGDMPGFEASPSQQVAVSIHQWILAGWGVPIGELFDLDELAVELEKRGRHTFFLSSVPLKVRGGVASPPNAVAIL
ncbi:hypothetical protein SPI_02179 [Niveomyces insectorum RCEF 264]|uniref:Cyclase n=1 Tax=Niveomyces insectorum RCEF 264 TaxID=1081102 RepID=A0A162J8P6_9HYPO|nr:hypothetical protein SPI_02179 [Niveomyces insectorum RCEF 264]